MPETKKKVSSPTLKASDSKLGERWEVFGSGFPKNSEIRVTAAFPSMDGGPFEVETNEHGEFSVAGNVPGDVKGTVNLRAKAGDDLLATTNFTVR
jgi:hypothetical protein